MSVEVLIQTANQELAKKGFAPTRPVSIAAGEDAEEAILRGSLVKETRETTGEIVRVVLYLPERDDLVELTGAG